MSCQCHIGYTCAEHEVQNLEAGAEELQATITRLTTERDEARGELTAVLREVQHHQPGGSPIPGNGATLTMWVLTTLAARATAAEKERDRLLSEQQTIFASNSESRRRATAAEARVVEVEKEWADMVPAVMVALGGTDPECVDPATVTATDMALHALDVRRALEQQRDDAKAALGEAADWLRETRARIASLEAEVAAAYAVLRHQECEGPSGSDGQGDDDCGNTTLPASEWCVVCRACAAQNRTLTPTAPAREGDDGRCRGPVCLASSGERDRPCVACHLTTPGDLVGRGEEVGNG